MGNQNSTKNTDQQNNKLKPRSISQILDYIATYYILTMDFKSLKKLYEKEYCDKLVILTSDIVQRYFTDMEITYLAKRVKNGVEVNEIDKDKVIFFNRDDLNKLDIQNAFKKKHMCLGIAKFYIKIAHIFAAIVTTINPIFVYKDTEGNTVRASLFEKGKIPKNTPRHIYKLNICDNRINNLKNNTTLTPDNDGNIYVGPKVCNININDDGSNKTLYDEPGIPELMDLYYDDNYDYESGKFTGMSDTTKKIFQENLNNFYKVFTGNQEVPQGITKFGDIKLKDYHKMEKCQGPDPDFDKKYKGPLTDVLFNNYAENLKNMIRTSNKNQESLLDVINKLFVYTIDPQTKKKQIRVNPLLTENSLQNIVIETRALIINLYLSCEQDYVKGFKIYEAIVEKQIYETLKKQLNTLNNVSDQLMTKNMVPVPAEVKQIKENNEKIINEKKEDIENIEKQVNDIKKVEEKLEADIPPVI